MPSPALRVGQRHTLARHGHTAQRGHTAAFSRIAPCPPTSFPGVRWGRDSFLQTDPWWFQGTAGAPPPHLREGGGVCGGFLHTEHGPPFGRQAPSRSISARVKARRGPHQRRDATTLMSAPLATTAQCNGCQPQGSTHSHSTSSPSPSSHAADASPLGVSSWSIYLELQSCCESAA